MTPTTPTRTVDSVCREEAFGPVASRRYWARPKTRRLAVRVAHKSAETWGRLGKEENE